MSYRYNLPTKLFFGRGAIEKMHTVKLPGKKALVVTSNGNSVISSGALDTVGEELKKASVEYVVFRGISSNPTKIDVKNGVKAFHDNDCDFIIGLGGGSVIDASKAIAIVAGNGGELWDYFHGGTAKAQPVKKAMVPLVAIPTTAGTGSEVDQWMVISDPETGEKIGFGFSGSFPKMAFVDSALMMTIPAKYTAFQGIDALLHSVEGYLSKGDNPITDALCLKAIELVGKHLSRAVANGEDEEAREQMAMASTISGIVLANKSMTAEHAIEDALSGAFHNLPHGAGLIGISHAYFESVISKHHSDIKFVEMAKALGMNDAQKPEDFLQALNDLYKKCNVAGLKLSDFGVTDENFEGLVERVITNGASEYEAERVILSPEECVDILKRSFYESRS